MKNDNLLKVAAGIVLVPIALGIVGSAISGVILGGVSLVERIQYKRKIKKGLKDGSIVEIDGQYYEVMTEEGA